MVLVLLLLAILIWLLTGNFLYGLVVAAIIVILFMLLDRPYGYRRRGGPPL